MALPSLLSSYQYVLHASFTAHKTIILELVRILACLHQLQSKTWSFKISIPFVPLEQFDRERFAARNSLFRFRLFLDFTAINRIIAESDLFDVENLSVVSID